MIKPWYICLAILSPIVIQNLPQYDVSMLVIREFQNVGQFNKHSPYSGDQHCRAAMLRELNYCIWPMCDARVATWREGFGPKWLNSFPLRHWHRLWDKPFSVLIFILESQGQPLQSLVSLLLLRGYHSQNKLGAGDGNNKRRVLFKTFKIFSTPCKIRIWSKQNERASYLSDKNILIKRNIESLAPS